MTVTLSFNWGIVLLITGCSLSYGQTIRRSAGETQGTPVLRVVGTNCFDLGTVAENAMPEVPFRIANTGRNTVRIQRLIPLCACIRAAADAEEIAPGGETTVRVILDARMLQGTFERAVWICADDTCTPYLQVGVTGKVVPLFSGLPSDPVEIIVRELGRPYTNRLNLIASRPGLSLGAPRVAYRGEGVEAAATLKPCPGETSAYDLVTVVTASTTGKPGVTVCMPVLDNGKENGCVQVVFQIVSGSRLLAIPGSLVLSQGGQPQSCQLILRGPRGRGLAASNLDWQPKPEGVRVTCMSGRSVNELRVKIDITPRTAAALSRSPTAAMLFLYPGCGPLSVPFVSTPRPVHRLTSDGHL